MANVTIVPTQEQNQRLSQMIVKKINANGRIVVVNQSQATNQIANINKPSPNMTVGTTNQRGGPR